MSTSPPLARRRFVQGLAAGGALAALGGWRAALASPAPANELRGTEFHLEIGETPVNFTGAARMLGTSKSAVSKQIARLETLLDVQLLRRTTRSLSPTAAGQTLYDRTAEAISLCRSAGGEVASLLQRPMGLLRVTAPMTLGRLVVAPALPAFLEAYPEMRVQLVLLDRSVDLAEEGFDIAIRTTRELPAGAVARPLGSTAYLLLSLIHI